MYCGRSTVRQTVVETQGETSNEEGNGDHGNQSVFKDGSEPVLAQLHNNMVFSVNNQKVISDFVGQLAEVSGQIKAKDGRVKLQSVKPTTADSIPAGDPARKLLDSYRTDHGAQVHEKIRHELAMMPYISNFDFISFTLTGSNVILTGWPVCDTNRDDAFRAVKNIERVEGPGNNIVVLPLGSFNMRIRAAARVALQRQFSNQE